MDNKHVQDIALQLQRLVSGLAEFHSKSLDLLKENILFPVEVDLSRNAFQYKSTSPVMSMVSLHFWSVVGSDNKHIAFIIFCFQDNDNDNDDELLTEAEEAIEAHDQANEAPLIPDIN